MSTYEAIRQKCLRTGTLWEDPDFPATADSIEPGHSDEYEWKRPKDISEAPPKFIVEGVSRFDLAQGELGDCWFVASAAVLTTKPELFARVVPPDQTFGEGYIGAFRFNFWRFGEWIEVVVDDRLPVYDGDLGFVFNRKEPNEFWGPLLEKAYAKVHGYYYIISEGFVRDALVDFTAGLSEMYNLRRPERLPEDLFGILHTSYNNGALMGAAVWNDKGKTVEEKLANGLYKGHAYSITCVKECDVLGSTVKLIRLRNPWGQSEWNGPWSDGSSEWGLMSAEDKQDLELVVEDDGEFWMSYDDVMAHFNTLDIVHLGPATFGQTTLDQSPVQWKCVQHHGKWVRGVNAGGNGLMPSKRKLYFRNPQFFVTLRQPDRADTDECTLVVSLMLKDYRQRLYTTELKRLIVGFDIHKVEVESPELLDHVTYEDRSSLTKQFTTNTAVREASVRLSLKPGYYVIIPWTFKADQEAPFLLRIFTISQADSVEIQEPTGPIEQEPEKVTEEEPIPRGSVPAELYTQFAGEDYTLDARDFKNLLNGLFETEFGQPSCFSVEACRTLIATVDDRRVGVMTFEETTKVWDNILHWKKLFERHDNDMSGTIETWELREVFKAIGFRLSFLTVSTLAVRYGGRDRRLFFEDFALCISKTLAMFGAFKEFSQDSPGEARLDLDEWMQTTLTY